jgi:Zn-dependent oligopeptidase
MFDYSNITKNELEIDLESTLKKCTELVNDIKNDSDPKLENFNNLEREINYLFGRVPFMADVHPNEEIREFGHQAESKVRNFILDSMKDPNLYQKFKEIKTNNFDDEEKEFYKDLQNDFIDVGHNLSENDRSLLSEIDKKLIELEIKFSENIANDKTKLKFQVHQLEGLSEGELNNLKQEDEEYTVTMAYPDVNAVIENCTVRETREAVWKAFNNRASKENSPVLEEAVKLRNKKAKLFGFSTWAQYRLQHRMAQNPENVEKMYKSLIPKLQKAAEKEKLEIVSDDIDISEIAPWDIRYFISKKRSLLSNIDSSELKKFFFIHDVKKEMFSICEEVFDIEIVEEDASTAWHPDVELWSISQEGEKIALFYLDLYPREGKYTHAAVFDLSSGGLDSQQLPVSSMVANFPNPKTGDGLMTFDEVETLFHEFGHILHNGIGKSKISRYVGASVEWDFVEAPSQIMEHWVWKIECLSRFAKNVETGEMLSEDICTKLKNSKNIGVSLLTLRQVSFGLADQHLHGNDFMDSLDAIESKSQKITTIDYPDDVMHLSSFGHLLGGYDAAYYGYLWADIIGDDLFSRFENEGILSNTVGVDYKNKILKPGGTKPAEELVRNFLGRDWNDESFLIQKNLLF